MNYLSHLHIADITQTSWVGNLLGDFSVDVKQLDEDLFIGWRLHQRVDVMVDNHQASHDFRSIPRKGRRRFSGIVQDVVMDYWLVQYWERFHTTPFLTFCDQAVAGLIKDKHRSPERLANMIASLESHNWLPYLGDIEGVERAIRSIMKRWRHGHHLQAFLDDLPTMIAQAEQPFLSLYPDVLDFVQHDEENVKLLRR